MNFEPVTLQGSHVRLAPLSSEHLDELCDFGLDPELWRWTTTMLRTREDMTEYVEAALKSEQEGIARPFATISLESDEVIGSTRFGNIDLHNRHVEIGWTCISVSLILNGSRSSRTSRQNSSVSGGSAWVLARNHTCRGS